MNTLKITKGNDVSIFVNDTSLCFVTGFTAKESCESYRIKEFLCDEDVAVVNDKKSVVITLNALSMLSDKVFEKEPFSIKVVCDDTTYEYLSCVVDSKERVIDPKKPLCDKYTIKAKGVRVTEDEQQ